jgi:hypothetical protein
MNLSPRVVGLLALLALAPAIAFVVLKAEWIAAVTLLNVVLIAGSLAVLFSPHEEHGNANGA